MSGEYEVAVYYFPQWHADEKNDRRFGKGWTEWERLKVAKPRFEGHLQPKVPAWGYLNAAKRETAELQIDAAADHGITTFIYDWYWDMGGGEGPYLHRPLEEGFLNARNQERLRFALMWANHNEVNRERWDALVDYTIEKYLWRPNYWRVNGGLYYSIYEIHTFIKGLGGIDAARDALESFRKKVASAGLPGLHLNIVEWGLKDRHKEIIGEDTDALLKVLGADSVTSYVWVHHAPMRNFPATVYSEYAKEAAGYWHQFRAKWSVPYYPNVTMGWDPSPRADQGKPYKSPVLVENTPRAFKEALLMAKAYLDEAKPEPKILTVYAWNEWTEGGYLEPDTVYGMGYLEAIRDVFGKKQ